MFKRIITLALVFGMTATAPPAPAQAQIACAPRGKIVSDLTKKHGEVAAGIGLSGPHALYEIWTSPKTGSWTIVLTRPNKLSCIIATGQGWHGLMDPGLKGGSA